MKFGEIPNCGPYRESGTYATHDGCWDCRNAIATGGETWTSRAPLETRGRW